MLLLRFWRFAEADSVFDDLESGLKSGEIAPDTRFFLGPNAVGSIVDGLPLAEWMLGLCGEDPARAEAALHRWFRARPAALAQADLACGAVLAWAEAAQGRYDQIDARARQIAFPGGQQQYGLFGTRILSCLALAYMRAGNAVTAADYAKEALRTAKNADVRALQWGSLPAHILAAAAFEQGDSDGARTLFARYGDVSLIGNFPDQLEMRFVTQARLAAWENDWAAADAVLRQGQSLADSWGFPGLAVALTGEAIRQAVARGDGQSAIQYAERRGWLGPLDRLLPGSGPDMATRVAATARARIDLMRGRSADVITVLTPWVDGTPVPDRDRGWVIDALLLAVAHGDLQHPAPRQKLARAALERAAEGGLLASCCGEGERVNRLVYEMAERLIALGHPSGTFFAAISQRLSGQIAPARAAAGDATETFSSREIQILGLIGRGHSNQDVAIDLGLSESTVKWYLQQIFDKLGVRQRMKAVCRARELGLVP